jgi:3-deoxy-manno-octulosonate cytidylyltransferase (CMP-KDO synthetase)|tara:strand:+ start:403 stop:1167 length:765 start_codon:yes stop_codon:yes gene_type:complete
MKIYGFIPARMASSRLPGKPLKLIQGRPMLQHVYERANFFKKWSKLSIATCDNEIKNFCKSNNYNFIMTSKKHKECTDRVFEAVKKDCKKIKNKDLVICIQGDEPMLYPNMIESVVNQLKKNKKAGMSVLGMEIINNSQFINPNIVKIVHNREGEVLYCSRSPIPHTKKFSKSIGAKRIYAIFAFRYSFLKTYSNLKISRLEQIESCGQNRVCDNIKGMYVAPYKYRPSFSVDTHSDLKLVNKAILKDSLVKKY